MREYIALHHQVNQHTNLTGFARMKPTGYPRVATNSNNPYKVKTEQFKEMIRNSGPYHFFITLTFKKHVNFRERCDYINSFLHFYNQQLFNHRYKEKKDNYMKGFAIFENHTSVLMEDCLHVHVLINTHHKFLNYDAYELESKFLKATSIVKDSKGRHIFSKKAVDFQIVSDENGAIEYDTKHIWDKTIDKIKPIGKDGLSDNEAC